MKNPPFDHQPQGERRSDSFPVLQKTLRGVARPEAKSETEPEFIYIDGRMLPFSAAAVHISKIAAGNGANVFEGLSLYANRRGQFLFRAEEHFENLRRSAWTMDVDCHYTDEEFMDAIVTSVRENRIVGDAHVRLSLFVTGERLDNPSGPVSLVCTARGRTSSSIHSRTVHAAISGWRRVEDPLMPPRVRAEANSHNARFGLLEVLRNGYDQAIFVSKAGKVGCGANCSFLLFRDGCLISPPETAETMERVARATLLQIAAEELGLKTQEREIDRSELTFADEAMFCGSGMEIRPVVSINKMRIGEGHVGPITRRLWHAYETIVRGRKEGRAEWLTPLVESSDWAARPPAQNREFDRGRLELTRSGQDHRVPRTGEIGHLLENGYQMGNNLIR